MRSFLAFSAFCFALAGQVRALEIAVGGSVGTISASDFLTVPEGSLMTQCQSQCSPANTAIQACPDDSCLCNTTTVTAITACEQCMFTQLIAANEPMPDPRAGSTNALTAYAAACLASVNMTVPTSITALTLPPTWDGPAAVHLDLAGTVVAVGMGAVLASGALYTLSNL